MSAVEQPAPLGSAGGAATAAGEPALVGTVDWDVFMPTYGRPTIEIVRGEGPWVWDSDGKQYLDFLCGLAVTSLGHAHPAVAHAVAHQAATLTHASNLFATAPAAKLAARIDGLLGGGGQVFFGNSGAEANECAIKLARRFGGHGRFRVISAYGSFHGRTLATLHATGQPAKHEGFQPLPEGFGHVAFGDLDAMDAAIDANVAAVLLEIVQGEGGVHPLDAEYPRAVERLCRERGVLLMIDEIQTGLCRTGSWFAFEASGITPDVVTLAKALGNGLPIGACWAKREVAAAFAPGDHGSTYGGNPVACAAGLAVLDTMEGDDLVGAAGRLGEYLSTQLAQLDGVAEVRGRGMLLAAELAPGIDAKAVAAELLARGLIVNAVTPTAIRMAPPLIIDEAIIDDAVGRLAAALAAVGDTADTERSTGADPERSTA